jgi:hypothetical protein
MYTINVELVKVICRDTESIHSSDRFALAGAVLTEVGRQGVYFPTMRINDGEERTLGTSYQLTSGSPAVGISPQGWDLDENDSWKEDQKEIAEGAALIAAGVALIPGAQLAAGVIAGVSGRLAEQILESLGRTMWRTSGAGR